MKTSTITHQIIYRTPDDLRPIFLLTMHTYSIEEAEFIQKSEILATILTKDLLSGSHINHLHQQQDKTSLYS
jgi:hypothetical protein